MNKYRLLMVSAMFVIGSAQAADGQQNQHLRRPTTWQQVVSRFTVGRGHDNQQAKQVQSLPDSQQLQLSQNPRTLADLVSLAARSPHLNDIGRGRGHA